MTTKSQQPAQEEESKGMIFQYIQPFRTSGGNIVRMKALENIHGKQYLVDESNIKHPAKELHLLTVEEIEDYQTELLYEQALLELDIEE